MRKIEIHLSIGYPAADRKWEVEIPDDMSDEDIDDLVGEEAYQYIEYGWKEQ